MTKEHKEMIRPAEAQKIFSVGRTTLYRWIKDKKIKSHSVGRMRFVETQSIRDHIKSQVSPP